MTGYRYGCRMQRMRGAQSEYKRPDAGRQETANGQRPQRDHPWPDHDLRRMGLPMRRVHNGDPPITQEQADIAGTLTPREETTGSSRSPSRVGPRLRSSSPPQPCSRGPVSTTARRGRRPHRRQACSRRLPHRLAGAAYQTGTGSRPDLARGNARHRDDEPRLLPPEPMRRPGHSSQPTRSRWPRRRQSLCQIGDDRTPRLRLVHSAQRTVCVTKPSLAQMPRVCGAATIHPCSRGATCVAALVGAPCAHWLTHSRIPVSGSDDAQHDPMVRTLISPAPPRLDPRPSGRLTRTTRERYCRSEAVPASTLPQCITVRQCVELASSRRRQRDADALRVAGEPSPRNCWPD